MKSLIVIAIGGNSLIKDAEHMTVLDQYRAAGETSHHIAAVVEAGYRVVITHGNGPQVGFIMLRSEIAKGVLHQVPLDSCVADTQGAIGYQICQTLGDELRRQNSSQPVAAVVTQVLVDRNDPGFTKPTKPIGPFYTVEAAQEHRSQQGWDLVEDAGRGWRRVVASPEPLEIVEENAIRLLLEQDVVVVAAGGGGIPVVRDDEGHLIGIEAVIDKDLTSSLLARNLGAEILLMSTSVDKVALHYGTPQQQDIDRMTVTEARRYLQAGHFAPGSMGPKVEAAIRFLEHGGREVVITQPHLLEAAIAGETGTHILP